MRVITGTARGRKLITLEGNELRPTSEKTKEAIFSIIQFSIEGSKVLDLFAGSGQLGIEALSRGAESCFFIDQNKHAVSIIKENLKNTELVKQATVLNTNARTFLMNTDESFNIAFLDPPYSKGLIEQLLPLVEKRMEKDGLILCEFPFGETVPENLENFSLAKTYKYGKTSVALYR